ncbi:S-layer homology domain-containing protein [Paenibacillus sp. GCM10023248]|uniref:S-layer homology domain-containing protein n=1 Tax=unclassified Paenibacillus TaxID=185978 RepID=UPI0023794821|nr:S-layer homology domain-containing protein [Paenibacillus sp. MAHUQ-63]MDD9272301.1 S-layer homology domain-containing protein [Paenibacillus sp. MAHUQ-63]
MKKTLSVVLTSAMALSMFSSLAFAAKSSADFTDLKDLDAATKAKFDAMISAGIFDGVSETTFGLKDEMNRAQFAKVAALIMGLDVNKDLQTSSFSDVSVTDAANGYALPYIEALKTAGVTDGYAEGQYNPAGKVTKEQLATFLVRVLGQDEAAKGKTGTDKTVSGWAQGYVAMALELKLLSNNEDGTFGGQANATRDLLLTGAYEAKQQYVPAGKVSVTGAKATGVQKVEVTFNKPVDTEKAALSLKKGSAEVATTTAFAADKKSAVITLTDARISNGEYTVSMSGLDAAAVDKTTATFKGEDEVLKSIDFVNAGDTVAYADKVIVKAKAVNQYGEAASTNAGSYDVYTSAATFTKLTKDTDGTLLITLDTKVDGQTTQGVSVIPVTIVNNDSHITVTKNFKLGTQPILTKLELGEARYSVGTALNGKGENVKYDLNLYDQYGSVMSYEMLNSENKLKDTSLVWNDYLASEDVSYVVEDNGNDIPQVKISLLKDVDKSGDFGFTVFNQAATATGKVSIQSAKVATKIEIGEMNDVIASGDTEVYVPVIGYDAKGNQLSAADLASDANVDRINVSISGATGSNKIVASGEHKGMIKLDTIEAGSKGAVSVTAVIATANANSTATKTYTVHDARIADHLKEVTVPAKNVVAGATSDFEFNVIDQYGQVLDDSNYVNDNGSVVDSATGNTKYKVVATAVTYDAAGKVIDNATAHVVMPNDDVLTTSTYEKGTNDFKAFNDEFTFETTKEAKEGTYVKFTAQIFKGEQEISKVERTLTVVGEDADLTYSVGTVAPLFNAMDSDVVKDSELDVATSKLAREVKISAKNAAGEAVELPAVITQITSSNTSVAQVAMGTGKDAGKGFVLGNKEGTATLNVTYQTVDGSTKQASVPVTVKSDMVAVDKLEAGETEATIGATGSNAYAVADLTVTDNYGVEYDKGEAPAYNYLLGLTFSTDNVKGKVEIGSDGTIKADSGSTFDLIITSPNGKSVVTSVIVK